MLSISCSLGGFPARIVAAMRPVAVTPGAMQLAVIPNGPRSCAR